MKAFEGIKVLDFTHVIAGPFATYQLALLGAEVIKVEEPEAGDYLRGRGGVDPLRRTLMGDHYACQNANKRSIALDLKVPEGVALARQLAERADVLVENFRPGVMEKLGLGYETLRHSNPRLIYCSLSGYGQSGEMSERPVYDNVVQAVCGLMAMTGKGDSGPLKSGAPILDYASGTMAAFALAAAIARRERFGEGQRLDVSMVDTAFMMMSPVISSLVNAGKAPRPHANDHALAAASCYPAADGELIMLGACNQRQFNELCRRIGREDLMEDPRFKDVRLQDPHRSGLEPILAAEMLKRSAAEWEALLADEVPAARVRKLAEALEDTDAEGRGVLTRVPYEGGPEGGLMVPVAAYRAETDGPKIDSPPPKLGQDGRTILEELGISPQELGRLAACGAVKL